MSKTREARERQGEAALVSLHHAAKLIGIPAGEFGPWLRQRGLVRVVCGREKVCWGDVLAATEAARERAVSGPVVAGLVRFPL